MSGISEIQTRIQALNQRVTQPPVPGGFGALLASQASTTAPVSGHVDGGAETHTHEDHFVVAPQAQMTTARGLRSSATQGVTLGVMLGITSTPALHQHEGSVALSGELAEYLQIHGIEARNGLLDRSELTAVSGGWDGSAYLLPPAAAAWEEMRVAAALDGINLQAIDTYRSWEVQEGAYHSHLRGEKKANVLPPGHSEHGNGLAVDITNGHLVGPGDPEHLWLSNNAGRYGWYPISNESWHWEFRGVGV
jgi:D-alanyl-D-alanine carboxypeptidase